MWCAGFEICFIVSNALIHLDVWQKYRATKIFFVQLENQRWRMSDSRGHSGITYKKNLQDILSNPHLSKPLWKWGGTESSQRTRSVIVVSLYHFILSTIFFQLDVSKSKWWFWQKWRIRKPKIRSWIVFTGSLVILSMPRELSDTHFDTGCDTGCEHHSVVYKVLHLLP